MSVGQWAIVVAAIALASYYLIYQLGYLAIIASAAHRLAADLSWPAELDQAEIFASPLTPRITVIVPAHNEAAGIIDSIESLRNIRYPDLEIVVVDDGSTDGTLAVLAEHYALVPVELEITAPGIKQAGPTEAAFRSADGTVTVLRKHSVGRRADAVNAALRVSDGELVCMIDGDSMLAPDSLLRLVAPFLDDSRVVAAGGTVLPSNGLVLDRGRVVRIRLPREWLVRFQLVEYLRAFLVGRSGWAQRNALVVISGAFGLYRRDVLLAVGGLDTQSLAEDADLLLAVHSDAVRRGEPYRVIFLAEPVCWTEVPTSIRVLGRQRTRWSHGLAEILSTYRGMVGRPAYGALGMLSLPWTVLFEWGAPLAVVLGIAVTVAAVMTGLITWMTAALAVVAAIALAALVTVAALTVEAAFFRRYARFGRVSALVATALVEPVFYRPLIVFWQLRGILRFLRGTRAEWGEMEHRGADARTGRLRAGDR